MLAIWPWLRFVLIVPGVERAPRPGSDHILPPGSAGFAAPADGAGVAPGAPPGRAGLNVHAPSGADCTSGDAGVSPPGGGVGCGCPGACAVAAGFFSVPGCT